MPDWLARYRLPKREIEHGGIEADAKLLVAVRSDVLGEAGDAEAESRLQVGAIQGFAGVGAGLGQEGGARDVAILLALRHAQVGQNHPWILLERDFDSVAQGQVERRGFLLSESAGGKRQ